MNNPWIYLSAGILLCAGGVYLFYRNIFEEDRSVVKPLLVIVAGVFLIALGSS